MASAYKDVAPLCRTLCTLQRLALRTVIQLTHIGPLFTHQRTECSNATLPLGVPDTRHLSWDCDADALALALAILTETAGEIIDSSVYCRH